MPQIENAIFWIEVNKILPNPYQPRKDFDENSLKELAESIRQYGVLQPLVVTRSEKITEDGSVTVNYELIAGERRLRASKLAGIKEVPCVVRVGDDNRSKLELAIIENIQREDLNAVDRAKSFQQLAEEFNLSWTDIGKKVGKSREYVSNSIRILMLPQDILDALSAGKISEGHTRPLLMLLERPAEQITLFKEMMLRKMTVREAEALARRVAFEKIRRKALYMNPEVIDTEEKLAESLGTRVHIEPKEKGGKIVIDYFSHEEFLQLANLIKKAGENRNFKGIFEKIKEEVNLNMQSNNSALTNSLASTALIAELENILPENINPENHAGELKVQDDLNVRVENRLEEKLENNLEEKIEYKLEEKLEDDRSKEDIQKNQNENDADLYDLKNFSL